MRWQESPGSTWDDPGQSADEEWPEIQGWSILRRLSSGSQGTVWLGVQASTGREAALKIVALSGLAGRARARFDREMELIGTLRHPGIVTLIDGGEAPGWLWFAMEHVRGCDLDEWIAAMPPRSLHERLNLFVLICDAVHHAHQRGVIHRDLKPANIRVDEHGMPRILDFGLGKGIGALPNTVAMTNPGAFAGTWTHASPEQVRGEAATLDTRTDVYSLGVILYEMLTGSHPHPGARDLPTLLTAIISADPMLPSRREKRLPRDLDAITLKALARDAAQRYASVEALASDVRRYREGLPVHARRQGALYVAGKLARRHRLQVALATVLLVALLTALGVAVTEQRRSRQATERAERAAAQARAEADRAVQVQRLMSKLMEGGRLGAPMTGRDVIAQGRQILDTAELDPDVRLLFMSDLVDLMLHFGLADEAAAMAADALSRRDETRPDAGTVRNLQQMGRAYMGLRQNERAAEFLARAVAMRQATGRSDEADYYDQLMMGVALVGVDRLAAREAFARSLESARKAPGVHDGNLIMALGNFASIHADLGEWETSDRLHHELLQREMEQGYGEGDLVHTLKNVAALRLAMGDAVTAESLLREVIRICGQLAGTSNFNNDAIKANLKLAEAVLAQDRGAEAESLARHALEMSAILNGEQAGPTIDALDLLATILRETGRPQEAVVLHERAVRASALMTGTPSTEVARLELNWAKTLEKAGRTAEAATRATRAFAMMRECPPPDEAELVDAAEQVAGFRGLRASNPSAAIAEAH